MEEAAGRIPPATAQPGTREPAAGGPKKEDAEIDPAFFRPWQRRGEIVHAGFDQIVVQFDQSHVCDDPE